MELKCVGFKFNLGVVI